MPIVSIQNEVNNSLILTQNESKWQLIGMTGLNPPNANVITSVVPTLDGSRYNSSRLEARNVVITLAIKGNVETNRMTLNSVIFPKRYLKTFYKNSTSNVFIEGYVESFEYDIFENGVQAQISIVCPRPYWTDVEETAMEISQVIDLFEFPFSIPSDGIAPSELLANLASTIINAGSVQTGAVFTITVNNTVLNPSILNVTTAQKMLINDEMSKGDEITITTMQGSKSILKYSDGEYTNIINQLDMSSEWIYLLSGENLFTLAADVGVEGMSVAVTMNNQYGGV